MEEAPRVSQIARSDHDVFRERVCERSCACACGRGLSVHITTHVPSRLLLRMAKLTFMSEMRNKTSASTGQNRRFLSVSFLLFFL